MSDERFEFDFNRITYREVLELQNRNGKRIQKKRLNSVSQFLLGSNSVRKKCRGTHLGYSWDFGFRLCLVSLTYYRFPNCLLY
jgi:hypothetical protein